jgi:hypothetical protein
VHWEEFVALVAVLSDAIKDGKSFFYRWTFWFKPPFFFRDFPATSEMPAVFFFSASVPDAWSWKELRRWEHCCHWKALGISWYLMVAASTHWLEYGGAPLGAHCFWLKRLVNTQNVPLSKSFIFSAAGINYCHDHF